MGEVDGAAPAGWQYKVSCALCVLCVGCEQQCHGMQFVQEAAQQCGAQHADDTQERKSLQAVRMEGNEGPQTYALQDNQAVASVGRLSSCGWPFYPAGVGWWAHW